MNVFSVSVPEDELWNAVLEVRGAIRFDGLRWVNNDFPEATEVAISVPTAAEITAIHAGARRTNARIQVAFLTANQVLSELAALYVDSALNNIHPSRVFATMARARAEGEVDRHPAH